MARWEQPGQLQSSLAGPRPTPFADSFLSARGGGPGTNPFRGVQQQLDFLSFNSPLADMNRARPLASPTPVTTTGQNNYASGPLAWDRATWEAPKAVAGAKGAFPFADTVLKYTPDDLKNDAEFAKIVATGALAESGWDPRKVQQGGGGRGLFQFDVNGGMGTGLSEAQLFDPDYQASKIVPLYADAYRKTAHLKGAQRAAATAVMAERPDDRQGQATRNYIAAYNSIAATAPAGTMTQDPNKAIAWGAGEVGKRYAGPVIGEADSMRWGNPGYDCSSFVSSAFKQVGVTLTPFTDTMIRQTQAVGPEGPQPGDLVFFSGYEDGQKAQYKHVAIYLGNNQVMDASYKRGVSTHSIDDLPGQRTFRRV